MNPVQNQLHVCVSLYSAYITTTEWPEVFYIQSVVTIDPASELF